MANKNLPHPFDIMGVTPTTLVDESDGTWTPAERSYLMGWSGTAWTRARVNAKGYLMTDRGNAGAELTVSADYTSAQTNTVLVSVPAGSTAHITSVLIGLHAGGSANAGATVKVGSNFAARHPGLPVGGGLSHTDLDVAGSDGDDITFTCDAPTGGTISVTVGYWIEAT